MTGVQGLQPASNWYYPNFLPPLPDIQAESPQAPDYLVLDKVELSLKSIYAARAGIHSSTVGVENRWDLKLNSLHATGLKTNAGAYAAKKTAIVAGGLSLVRNIASLAQGDVNVARATGNVASDIASGAIGGMAAGVGGAMGFHGFLNSGKFISGTVGTIVGAVGFVAADYLLDKSGIKDAISDGVTGALEKVDGQSHLPVML